MASLHSFAIAIRSPAAKRSSDIHSFAPSADTSFPGAKEAAMVELDLVVLPRSQELEKRMEKLGLKKTTLRYAHHTTSDFS